MNTGLQVKAHDGAWLGCMVSCPCQEILQSNHLVLIKASIREYHCNLYVAVNNETAIYFALCCYSRFATPLP